ncbi:hypothetical protein QFZ99_001712 [Paraburkholderia atlantica]
MCGSVTPSSTRISGEPADAVEQFGEVLRERQIARARDHALMALGAREAPQTRFVGGDQTHARVLRGLQKFGHTTVLTRRVVIDILDRRRIVPDTRGHCVETV